MKKTDIAREWRKKHPNTPTAQLARLMYKANKHSFDSPEHARSSLRYIEGKNGTKNKAGLADKSLVLESARPVNPYGLPPSEEATFEPYKIKGHKRMLVASDIHLPYHSMTALNAMIKFAKKDKPDAILFNGDLLDFYQASRFLRDPRLRSIADELETAREFFDVIQKQIKGAKIYFKLGNHEERYEHYLYGKAPELLGVEDFKLDRLLRLKEKGIEYIDKKRIVYANELTILHGHEFIGGITAPVNIARGLFLKAKASAMQGHNHASSEHTEPNVRGKITTTWSTGCLSELNPAYMPINKWNHGFAVVDLDEKGTDFHVRNMRIYEGKIL